MSVCTEGCISHSPTRDLFKTLESHLGEASGSQQKIIRLPHTSNTIRLYLPGSARTGCPDQRCHRLYAGYLTSGLRPLPATHVILRRHPTAATVS